MKKYQRITLFIAFLALTGFGLAGCGIGNPPAGRVPGPDFSRGLPLSSNVGGTVGMLFQESTGSTHFVWPTADDDLAHIHYLRLDKQGDIAAEFNLNLPSGRQRTPRLADAGNDRMHLVWGNRISGSRGWTLWYSLLDDNGNLVEEPTQISANEIPVGDFVLVGNGNGNAVVVWEQATSKGIWLMPLTAEGVTQEARRLTDSGGSPGAYIEEDGSIHLSWIDNLELKYTSAVGEELDFLDRQTVFKFESIVANVDGPVIGVSGRWVYILWSVFARSGLQSGTGWTEYVAFPKGEATSMASTRVWILTDEEQPYLTYDGAYNLTELAPAVTSPALSANYILEPAVDIGQGDELAVTVAADQVFRLEEIIQMAVLVFMDGEFYGYQMAGKTNNFSREGIIQSNNEGDLFLAWREGAGRQLYYATTDSELRSGINKLGQTDILQVLVDGGFEAITGALFFPLSFIWFVPGGVLLGIWRLRRDDETVEEGTSRIFLVLSILLYEGTKFLFFPSIMAYIPFSAWLDFSTGLGSVLQFVVPLSSLALGILFAEWVRRRRSETPSLLYFFCVGGLDAMITLMIYGVNFLGVL